MPQYDLLNLDLTLGEDGRLSAQVGGRAAADVGPFVDRFVHTLNGLKVIARRDGGNVYNLYNPPQPSNPGVRALTRKLRELLFGHVFPATVNIAVTSACQCRCAHCSADLFQRQGRLRREDLTGEEIRRIVDEGLDLGANLIIFTGGEPLLRSDLIDLIRYVDKDRAVVMIFTNGFLLDEEKARALQDAGLYSINISVDDSDAEAHDHLRGLTGSHARAFGALKASLEAGLLSGISTYATSENLASGGLAALLERARAEGAHEVTIFDCIPSGKYLWNTELMLSEAEKREVIRLARAVQEGSHSMGVVAMARVNSPKGAGCFGGFSQMYVTCHGDVNPCDFNPISFGNVRELPLQAIWEKMVRHPEFGRRQMCCRMQSTRYRSRYIDAIPSELEFPIPVEALPGDGTFRQEAYERFMERMKKMEGLQSP
ncbi:MAG: radical SAM/SPASM domain-containing protein [Planctomycetota bacterium]|jgi:MoaA/NifB/PqqE/SkfB family radical SAM enzyme